MTTLLQQIEDEALDSGSNLADVLRKCIALGGRSGSDVLREWATHELRGYGSAELPEYRIIPAILAVDFRTVTHHVTEYQISPLTLPEPARSLVKEEVTLGGPIAEIIDAAEIARQEDGVVKFGLPGGSTLADLMNALYSVNGGSGQVIDRVYYKCSATSLVGAIDAVRTTLIELVAEMRSTTVPGEDPPKEAADRAVEIVIHGGQPLINIASNNTITDSQNVSLSSQCVQQSIGDLPQGDVDALLGWLVDHGVPGPSVDELRDAIDSDAEVVGRGSGPGDKVKLWIANATLKGASAIGTGVSVDLVLEVIKHFFGI